MTVPSVPAPNGGFHVTPVQLYSVGDQIAVVQGTQLDRGAKDLLKGLQQRPDAGGNGDAARAFARSYVAVGKRFLEVWAKSVVSVGGAATGFVITANNYVMADAKTAPGAPQPQLAPLPQVITSPPAYGSVPNLRWGDVNDGGDDFLRTVFEFIPGWVRDILHPVVKHAFRMGKAADVYPFPQQHYLNELSIEWRKASTAIGSVDATLDVIVSSITYQPNNEWYEAMRQFCSSLWGTTAWGAAQGAGGYRWSHDSAASPTSNHPVMSALFDTAEKIAQLLRLYGDEAVTLNHDVHVVYTDAVKDAIPKIKVDLGDGLDLGDVKGVFKGIWGAAKKGTVALGTGIVLNADTGRLNTIVETYNERVRALIPQLDALLPVLDEAYLSAPTFQAETARAQAFGARSLQDFTQDYHYTVPGTNPDNLYFPVDLAAQEGVRDAHTFDKHVGLTDEQLAQRLRDQAGAPNASTFSDSASAQYFTQEVLNDDANAIQIESWLKNTKQKIDNDPNYDWENNGKTSVSLSFGNQTQTGTVVQRDANGVPMAPAPAHSVIVGLKYNKDHDPPYIVVTSYPKP